MAPAPEKALMASRFGSDAAPKEEAMKTQRADSMIGGMVLVALGGVFLIQNLTGLDLGNWWALFLLGPGVLALVRAYGFFEADQGFSGRALAAAIGGGVLTLLGLSFLFNLALAGVWPLILIGLGLAAMVRPHSPRA